MDWHSMRRQEEGTDQAYLEREQQIWSRERGTFVGSNGAPERQNRGPYVEARSQPRQLMGTGDQQFRGGLGGPGVFNEHQVRREKENINDASVADDWAGPAWTEWYLDGAAVQR